MLANFLRISILAASAALPENAAIANVVFASSLQILIAVAYFIVFTVVTATFRVLSSHEAIRNPSVAQEMDFDLAYNSDGDLHESENQNKKKHVRQSRLQVLRNLRDSLHQEADRLASHLFLQRTVKLNNLDEGAREANCDDNFSITSQDETTMINESLAKPISSKEKTSNESQDDIVNELDNKSVMISSSYKGGIFLSEDRIDRKKVQKDESFDLPSTKINDSGYENTTFNVYSDVYAFGFSVFIMHYCLDAASMNPTMFLLIGLTILALKDELQVSREELNYGKLDESLTLVRALSVSAFLLISAAQICVLVGIARVPTYHTAARGGGIFEVPAPSTVLEILLATILPLSAPGALHFIKRRQNVNMLSGLLRTALPCTVLVALWFITCFGAMNEQIRDRLGVASVNISVTALTSVDEKQLPTLLLAPFFKVPALLCIISCCLSGNTIDIVCSLALIFYAKQHIAVRDGEMQQMLLMGLIFASFAWSMCTLRHCNWLMVYTTKVFSRSSL